MFYTSWSNGIRVSIRIQSYKRVESSVVDQGMSIGNYGYSLLSWPLAYLDRRLWVPSQYPKRRLFLRSRKVSKPRDWYFKLSYRFEIWQAHRQHCCRSACQISERSDNSKYKSRGFETLRDLTERRLFGYWDGAQNSNLFLFYLHDHHCGKAYVLNITSDLLKLFLNQDWRKEKH